ncbi:MAG: ATP-grasp domain-containing protein [Hyphomicrobiales bacterium]|nr:ATP-grasp domain-containing protein [Hyphomicrobiales bacterium]
MTDCVKHPQRILVANRGEIAVRIIKSIHRLGMQAIAVYSQFDKNAQHVKLADEAIFIGEGPAVSSYLAIENIIDAAKSSKADAIHPGYGFLSENSDFALACKEADIVFVGPTIEAMEIMGDKASAKRQMLECDIACIDGYQDEDQSDEAFERAANNTGYPLMIKAANGGGGRGMRLVEQPEQLFEALSEARGEALGSFGSDRLIMEKAVANARHIEFQILGDQFGNLVHLGERDCSLQRRHQKVIEEAPSPALNAALRQKMGEAAVRAAKSVSYHGAGTIEFLLDENNKFFFLEMNTRLQVEHPATEMVTGLDLVEWQIRIAAGERLGLKQSDIKITGHAIEARIYAEDPAKKFMPTTGKVHYWREPEGGGVRVDSGIVSGDHIGPHYDAMLAKVIVHNKDGNDAQTNRNRARRGLIAALNNTVLLGPQHNKQFLLELLGSDDFADGETNINTIDASADFSSPPTSIEIACIAAVLDFVEKRELSLARSVHVPDALLDWSSSPLPPAMFKFENNDSRFEIAIRAKGDHQYLAECGDRQMQITLSGNQATIEGRNFVADQFMREGNSVYLSSGGGDYKFVDISKSESQISNQTGDGTILSPMHGILVEVSAHPGLAVDVHTKLAVLEAMKMRHEILAGVKGVVRAILKPPGTQVSADDVLFEIELEAKKDATSV